MKFQLNIDFRIDPESSNKSLLSVKLDIKKAIRRYGLSLKPGNPLKNRNIIDINVHKISEDKHLQRTE